MDPQVKQYVDSMKNNVAMLASYGQAMVSRASKPPTPVEHAVDVGKAASKTMEVREQWKQQGLGESLGSEAFEQLDSSLNVLYDRVVKGKDNFILFADQVAKLSDAAKKGKENFEQMKQSLEQKSEARDARKEKDDRGQAGKNIHLLEMLGKGQFGGAAKTIAGGAAGKLGMASMIAPIMAHPAVAAAAGVVAALIGTIVLGTRNLDKRMAQSWELGIQGGRAGTLSGGGGFEGAATGLAIQHSELGMSSGQVAGLMARTAGAGLTSSGETQELVRTQMIAMKTFGQGAEGLAEAASSIISYLPAGSTMSDVIKKGYEDMASVGRGQQSMEMIKTLTQIVPQVFNNSAMYGEERMDRVSSLQNAMSTLVQRGYSPQEAGSATVGIGQEAKQAVFNNRNYNFLRQMGVSNEQIQKGDSYGIMQQMMKPENQERLSNSFGGNMDMAQLVLSKNLGSSIGTGFSRLGNKDAEAYYMNEGKQRVAKGTGLPASFEGLGGNKSALSGGIADQTFNHEQLQIMKGLDANSYALLVEFRGYAQKFDSYVSDQGRNEGKAHSARKNALTGKPTATTAGKVPGKN